MEAKKSSINEERRVEFSRQASLSLNQIERYLAVHKQSPITAVKVIDALLEKVDQIAIRPKSYKLCPWIKKNKYQIRQAICKSWYIFFTIEESRVLILDFIHSSRSVSLIRKETKKGL